MATASASPQAGQRLHHLDALRALLMLQILPFHAGSIYAVVPEWLVISHERSLLVTSIIGWFGIFSMTGFFIISSWLTVNYLKRRDAGQWAKMRLERIGIPLIVCVLTISPLAMIAGSLAARLGTVTAESWGYTGDISDDLLTAGRHWIGHLWFLVTILVYTGLVLLLTRGDRLNRLLTVSTRFIETHSTPLRTWLLVLAFGAAWRAGTLLIFFTLRHGFGIETPFLAVIDIKNWLIYIPPFALGLMMGFSPVLREHLLKLSWPRIIFTAATACFLVYYPPADDAAGKLIRAVIRGSCAFAMCFVAIALVERYFTREHGWAKFVSRHSYSVYLVHYPIVAFLGVAFMLIAWPPIIEFSIITAIAFAISFAIAILISRTAILRFLYNGIPMEKQETKAISIAGSPAPK